MKFEVPDRWSKEDGILSDLNSLAAEQLNPVMRDLIILARREITTARWFATAYANELNRICGSQERVAQTEEADEMVTFQNEEERQVWRETLLHWDGVVQEGFDMADKVVLAYRERCPKNSVGFVPKIGDPWPFNFCDVKPLSMPDIRIVEPTTGEESTNNKETK